MNIAVYVNGSLLKNLIYGQSDTANNVNALTTSQPRQGGQAVVFSPSEQPSWRTNRLVTGRFRHRTCPQLRRDSAESLLCTDLAVVSWSCHLRHLCVRILPDSCLAGGCPKTSRVLLTDQWKNCLNFCVKLQGSAIGLVFNSYVSLAIRPSKILDFLIIFFYFLLSFWNTFFTCLDNLHYTFLGLNHLQMSPCLTIQLK